MENACIRTYSYSFLWLSHRIYRLLILNSTSWKMVGQTENYFHSFLPVFLNGKYFAKNVDVGFHFWAGNARASKLHIWKHEWKVRCYAVSGSSAYTILQQNGNLFLNQRVTFTFLAIIFCPWATNKLFVYFCCICFAIIITSIYEHNILIINFNGMRFFLGAFVCM